MKQRVRIQCVCPNPLQARYWMSCGQRLPSSATIAAVATPAQGVLHGGAGWSGAVAALITLLGLWHISRKTSQRALAMLFLLLFFRLPMVCGFAIFALEWLRRLFH